MYLSRVLTHHPLRWFILILIGILAMGPLGTLSAQGQRTWTVAQVLQPNGFTPATNGDLGSAIDIAGDTLALGARNFAQGKGVVLIFVSADSGQSWTQQAALTDKDGKANDHLGGLSGPAHRSFYTSW